MKKLLILVLLVAVSVAVARMIGDHTHGSGAHGFD